MKRKNKSRKNVPKKYSSKKTKSLTSIRKKISSKKKIKKGGYLNLTTQGCPVCPASNPTMSELAWNNRYTYGKGCASGWGKKGGYLKQK